MPTVNICPFLKSQYLNDTGVPLAGGLLYTYYAGTTDEKTTYSDAAGTVANTNPIVLDAAGRADIFLSSGAYDFLLTDEDDVTIWSASGISASTVTTDVATVAALKALSAGSTSIVRTLGYSAANDGGGWWYYWSAASSTADNGGTVIQPDSLPATGRWLAFMPSNREMNLRVFGATCDNVADDITHLQAADTWCNANGCVILIDGDTYFSTNPSLSSRVKLLPGATLRWGNFQPTLDVIIGSNDKTQHFITTAAYIPILNVCELYAEWFGEVDASSHPITDAVLAAIANSKRRVLINSHMYNSSEMQLDGDFSILGVHSFTVSGGLSRLYGSVIVGDPTGGDKGAGTINAVAVYDDNVLLTGYVLDKFFNPDYSLDEWKNKCPDPASEFETNSPLMFDIDSYCHYLETNRMLPTFEDVEKSGEIPSTGAMIQKLWEVVEVQSIHIKLLNDRLKKLEGN